jgi:hypothetical protein
LHCATNISFSVNVLCGIHCVRNAKYVRYDVVGIDTANFSNLWKIRVATLVESNPLVTDDDCEKALF